MLDVAAACLRYPKQLRTQRPQRTEVPRGVCVPVSGTEMEEARTPGLSTRFSDLGAPAHFTLTIHFLDTKHLLPLFQSFS